MILETERTDLRKLTSADWRELSDILQDEETMTAYAHAFSNEEVSDWLERQLERYARDGFGLWAVERKADGAFLGQAGLTWQDWNGRRVPEIGDLFKRVHWHQGYAAEAAAGCKKYAFETLGFERVYSIIRDTNLPSRRVALRNGMRKVGSLTKRYYGMDMPHDVYCVQREN